MIRRQSVSLIPLLLLVGHGAAGAQTPVLKPPREMLQLRDPFKRPPLVQAKEAPKTDLESFSTEELKLVGVVTGPDRLRAMILAPNGKTYFLSEKMKVGTRNGTVKRITPEKVIVRESVVNVLGEEENVDVEIRFPVPGSTGAPAPAAATQAAEDS